VQLERPNLEDLPDALLPPPFRLRWYRPGDAEAWVEIHRQADPYNDASAALFRREFGDDHRPELPARQCYAVDADGKPVGTITAWFGAAETDLGRVHWLAVLPACRRQGIGRALLTTACRRLRQLGHRRAYLRTSTARLAAIRLYRQFGFVPQPRSAEEQRLWQILDRILDKDR
jgi:ribosomal protein S18 acetylase RimI-like enzyme